MSYRYFSQLCLGRKHHQRNTHIQTPSRVTHHLPRVHHTCKSLVSPGCWQLQCVVGTGGLWGIGGLWGTLGVQDRAVQQLPPCGAPQRGLQTAPTWNGVSGVPPVKTAEEQSPTNSNAALPIPLKPALPSVAIKNRDKSSCKWLWQNHLARARKWSRAKEMGGGPRPGGGGRRL